MRRFASYFVGIISILSFIVGFVIIMTSLYFHTYNLGTLALFLFFMFLYHIFRLMYLDFRLKEIDDVIDKETKNEI